MSDIEQHKSKLEDKISKIQCDFSLVISEEKRLAEKVSLFLTKCKDLERQLAERDAVSSTELRALKRQVTSLNEVKTSQEMALTQFQRDLQKLTDKHNLELEQERDHLKQKEKSHEIAMLDKIKLENTLLSKNDDLQKMTADLNDARDQLQKEIASSLSDKQGLEDQIENLKA